MKISFVPSSSGGTSFETMDRIAMNEVPLKISAIAPTKSNFF